MVERTVRCVVRLVLWCVNGRGYFLGWFILSMGGFLFGAVI